MKFSGGGGVECVVGLLEVEEIMVVEDELSKQLTVPNGGAC